MPAHKFLMICTTSSSSRTWSFPTVCGLCFAEVPQTRACLNSFSRPLWIEPQKSAIEAFLLIMTGAS